LIEVACDDNKIIDEHHYISFSCLNCGKINFITLLIDPDITLVC